MPPDALPAQSPLIEGPLSTAHVFQLLSCSADSGAHAFFLGQVRADPKDESQVTAIDYTCYPEMACKQLEDIRLRAIKTHTLLRADVLHSVGEVKAGEISLIVVVSSKHRASAFSALSNIVDLIKAEVPIWGREIYANEISTWKKNI